MDVDGRPVVADLAQQLGDRRGAGARSEWMATPAFTAAGQARCTAVAHQMVHQSGVLAKRRWSSRSVAWAKPARSYSTGSSVRPMPASATRRLRQRLAHGRGSAAARRCRAMVQVVELADLGVAAAQQFAHTGALATACICSGVMRSATPVHAVAPGPEVVGIARVAPLGQADKGALERMAVRVHQPGSTGPGSTRGARHTGGVDTSPCLPAPVAQASMPSRHRGAQRPSIQAPRGPQQLLRHRASSAAWSAPGAQHRRQAPARAGRG
jgi:hypothetical protein